jgi:hypothetical protein
MAQRSVKVVVGQDAQSNEVFKALKNRLDAYSECYRMYQGMDSETARMYFTLATEMEELLVELFDAKVELWGNYEHTENWELE